MWQEIIKKIEKTEQAASSKKDVDDIIKNLCSDLANEDVENKNPQPATVEKSVEDEVFEIKRFIENNETSESELLEKLKKLDNMQMTMEILTSTVIGKTVKSLEANESKEVKKMATEMITKWKEIVIQNMNKEKAEKCAVGGDNMKDGDGDGDGDGKTAQGKKDGADHVVGGEKGKDGKDGDGETTKKGGEDANEPPKGESDTANQQAKKEGNEVFKTPEKETKKDSEKQEFIGEDQKKKRQSKRTTHPAEPLCSPYMQRVVQIKTKTEKIEERIAEWMFSTVDDPW